MLERWKVGQLARFRIKELSPDMLKRWKVVREHNLTYGKKITQKYRYYKAQGHSSVGAYTLAAKSLNMAGLTPINEKEWIENV